MKQGKIAVLISGFIFAALYLYYFFVVDASLYYHFYQPLFLFEGNFFKEFMAYPGGILDYVTLFFLQFFCYNGVGSLILSLFAVTAFIIVYRLFSKTGNIHFPLAVAFIPAILLAAIQSRYHFPVNLSVKYLFSLILFYIYTRVPARYRIIMILLSGLIYYLLGGWFFLFYSVLCLIQTVFSVQGLSRYVHSVLCLIMGAAVPYFAARYFFFMNLREAYLYRVPFEYYFEPYLFRNDLHFYALFLSLPVLLLLVFVLQWFRKEKRILNGKAGAWLHRWSVPGQFAAILLIGGLVLTFSREPQEKKKIQIDALTVQGRWEEVLKTSTGMEDYDRLVNFEVNRAFYHTGQLLENLFRVEQRMGVDGLFIDKITAGQIAIYASDLYLELGHINASLVMANEAETKFGYNPRILKRLALLHLINGKNEIAKKYLGLLSKSLICRKWAKHYADYLYDESLAASDPFIREKRQQRPDVDFFIDKGNPTKDLIHLCQKDPDNRMAFEYFMAYSLLDSRLGDLQTYYDRFGKSLYSQIPRHIEEAFLLIQAMFPSKIDLTGYSIRPETVERFRRFNLSLKQFAGNESQAKKMLWRDFGDTYWYYVRFVSPRITKIKLKADRIHAPI